MTVINEDEFRQNKERFVRKITDGELFIHPTDTIYGLSCDATNDEALLKLRELKNREDKPFSVLAPSKTWIEENCIISQKAKQWLDRLPGPYTLILSLKNKEAVSKHVAPGLDSIGVRIPDHWFAKEVELMGVPVVTSSANVVGEDFMTSIENINPTIKHGVHFIIYEGEKIGRPSKLINLTGEEPDIVER